MKIDENTKFFINVDGKNIEVKNDIDNFEVLLPEEYTVNFVHVDDKIYKVTNKTRPQIENFIKRQTELLNEAREWVKQNCEQIQK